MKRWRVFGRTCRCPDGTAAEDLDRSRSSDTGRDIEARAGGSTPAPNGSLSPTGLDRLLMATAQCHGLTMVTRNGQDFAHYPQVLNPWAL